MVIYMSLYFTNMELTHRLILQSDVRIAWGQGDGNTF